MRMDVNMPDLTCRQMPSAGAGSSGPIPSKRTSVRTSQGACWSQHVIEQARTLTKPARRIVQLSSGQRKKREAAATTPHLLADFPPAG